MTVGSANKASCAVLLALVDAMCELLAATSSDTDGEELHQNISNVFLDTVTGFQLGDKLEAYLTEKELDRVGLCCRLIWNIHRDATVFLFFSFGRSASVFPPEMTLCAKDHLTSSCPCQGGPAARGWAHGFRPWCLCVPETSAHRKCEDQFSQRVSSQVKSSQVTSSQVQMRERSWKRLWNPPCRASRTTTLSTGRLAAL